MGRAVKDFDKPEFIPKILPPLISENSHIRKTGIFFSHELSLLTLEWVKINQGFFKILGKTRAYVSKSRINHSLKKFCFKTALSLYVTANKNIYFFKFMGRAVKDFDKPGFIPKILPP